MEDAKSDSDGISADEDRLPSGLYIIATPIGNIGDISLRALEILSKVDAIACEDTRESGKLTSVYDITARKISYHDHNADDVRPQILRMIGEEGLSVALISDAGMPLVSDPGFKLVRDCRDKGLYVTCVPGASAPLTALVLSGIPSDRFMFCGFLPPKSAARKRELDIVKSVPSTLIFFETAPRLQESLADMRDILGNRQAAVARELTKKFEEVRRADFDSLIAHYATAGDPRGEIVIVVEAPQEDSQSAWTDDRIDDVLRQAMTTEGLSLKDAAALVAAKSGRRRNDVYQRALGLKGTD